jgi:hypothetical protein
LGLQPPSEFGRRCGGTVGDSRLVMVVKMLASFMSATMAAAGWRERTDGWMLESVNVEFGTTRVRR